MTGSVTMRVRWAVAIAALLLAGLAVSAALGHAAFAAGGAAESTGGLRAGTLSDIQAGDAASASDGASGAASDAAAPTSEELLANATITVQANVKGKGWLKTVKAGKVAGTRSKKAVQALKVSLVNAEGAKGSVCYRLYSPKSGWTKTAKDGAAAKAGKKGASAVRIWLKGDVSKHFDVYYQGYIKGYGWLDWATNKQIAGTTSLDTCLSAVRVKLVKKGEEFAGPTKTYRFKDRWAALEFKYRDNDEVGQLLEVKYTGGVKAKVVLRQKRKGAWKTLLSCKGYVGSRGIGTAREGVSRTPSGDFGITEAFGIKDDPGAILTYVHVHEYLYWCSDSAYYNTLIDITDCPHDCTGEQPNLEQQKKNRYQNQKKKQPYLDLYQHQSNAAFVVQENHTHVVHHAFFRYTHGHRVLEHDSTRFVLAFVGQ